MCKSLQHAEVFQLSTVRVLIWFLCLAMVGFGLGGSHIAVTLLMEIVPPSKRNNMLSIFQVHQNRFLVAAPKLCLGIYCLGSLGWVWLGLGFLGEIGMAVPGSFHFRSQFPRCASAVLVWLLLKNHSILITTRLPESPLWLVVAKRPSQSATILQKMANVNSRSVDIDESRLATSNAALYFPFPSFFFSFSVSVLFNIFYYLFGYMFTFDAVTNMALEITNNYLHRTCGSQQSSFGWFGLATVWCITVLCWSRQVEKFLF